MSKKSNCYEEIKVHSVVQAIDQLIGLRDKDFYSFRGQRNSTWGVGPHNLPIDGPRLTENVRQYIKRCKEFVHIDVDEHDYWRSLFFAQHHGLKTRLLDWTSNPLVALYFAVENVLTNCDDSTHGAVWALKVNKKKLYVPEHIPETLHDWIMINPPLITDRIIRQSGKFTYHPESMFDDLSTLQMKSGDELVKVTICADKKSNNPTREIREHLWILNVHHAALFPDPDGVAHFINKQWRHITRELHGEQINDSPWETKPIQDGFCH